MPAWNYDAAESHRTMPGWPRSQEIAAPAGSYAEDTRKFRLRAGPESPGGIPF